MRTWCKVLVVVSVCNLVGAVYAQDDILSLSIEELMEIKVSTASKRLETVGEASAIMSVITAQDIERMPYRSLYDIIQTVPGVTVTESFFGYSSISFRGIKETHYNNRTLFMINGHAVSDVTVGSAYLEAIPINAIQQIEIIRGPASVVYGNGAFAGVINVITKSGVDGGEIAVQGGSQETLGVKTSYGLTQDGIRYFAAVSYLDSEGYNEVVADEAGLVHQLGSYAGDKDALEKDFYNAFISIGNDKLTLDAFHFNMERDKFGIIPVHETSGETKIVGTGVALDYIQKVGEVEFTLMAQYSQYEYEGYLNSFPPGSDVALEMSHAGAKAGVGLECYLDVTEDVSLLSGMSYEHQKTDPYEFHVASDGAASPFAAFLKKYDSADVSVYAQVGMQLHERLTFTPGGRYNDNSDYGGVLVPRASAVYKAEDNLYVKALYAEAYRNPTFFEKYVNTQNVLYGDPQLDPEKIETSEVGLDWFLGKTSLKVNGFFISTDDRIARSKTYEPGQIPPSQQTEQRVPGTAPTRSTPGYGNTSGDEVYGVEVEVRGDLVPDRLTGSLSLSYKDGEQKDGGEDIEYLDEIVGTVALTYTQEKLAAQLAAHYVGEREGHASATTGLLTAGDKITVDDFIVLNIKVSYRLADAFTVVVSAMNLFEQEYDYPEYIRSRITGIPGDSERTVFAELAYSF